MTRFFTLLFAAGSLISRAQIPDYVPTDGLVAWYPFNGNANDESGNGLHASEFDVAFVENRNNVPSSCIELVASNSEVITPILGVSGGQSRTVSFWVSKVSLNEHWGFTNAVGSHQNGDPGTAFGCGFNFGTLQGVSIDVENGVVTYQSNLNSTSGEWVHYAFAVPYATEVRVEDVLIYENGELLENILYSLDPGRLLNTLSWEYIIGGAEGFDGSLGLFEDQNLDFGNPKIDDVGFWNRALTEEEILALYISEPPVLGCTDSMACNFNVEATIDEGCIPSGCMDLEACNYNALAECDGEACDYSCCPGPGCCGEGMHWDWELEQCQNTLPGDTNGDGCVQLNDLLDVLSAYWNCGQVLSCGDLVSYQGYDYATVLIGEQCWFAENLRNESYDNGDAIPAGLSDSEWSSTTSGATAVYGESASNLETYGRLYNWYAVDDERGLCPSGWHVPTDGEWMTMEMALGMSESEANSTGWRGTDQGIQMKTTYGWYGGGNGTNSSGFSGLPGGSRSNLNGNFYNAGENGYWWSSSPSGSSAWDRYLNFGNENVSRYNVNLRLGFSVRCVRDAE